jgi:hypothetical protein
MGVPVLAALLLLGLMVSAPPLSAQDTPLVVGRFFYVEPHLLRFVPAEKGWVEVPVDASFAAGDDLATDDRGRVEMLVPNATVIRIDKGTRITVQALGPAVTEVDIASGVARFSNRAGNVTVRVRTPFGSVSSSSAGAFDVYVGRDAVEVVALKGKAVFAPRSGKRRYDVVPGSPSVVAGKSKIASGQIGPYPKWDAWNMARDTFWATRTRKAARSSRYLPRGLREEAYPLDENGRWESVYYEGAERWALEAHGGSPRMGAIHRGPVGRVGGRRDVGSRRALRLPHAPLWGLGPDREEMVLGAPRGGPPRRKAAPRRGLRLVSGQGPMDLPGQRRRGVGAPRALRDLLLTPQMGRTEHGNHERRGRGPHGARYPQERLYRPGGRGEQE